MVFKDDKAVIDAADVITKGNVKRKEKLTVDNFESFLDQLTTHNYTTIRARIPHDPTERFKWAKSFNNYLKNQRNDKKRVATSHLSPGPSLDAAIAHNMNNNQYVATSHLSPGPVLDAAIAHNAKNGFFIALGNLIGDQHKFALQSNVNNNYFPTEESQKEALKRINPANGQPLSKYLSTPAECEKEYVEGRKDKVFKMFNNAASLFTDSRDHTVGVAGVEPEDQHHFSSYGGMTFTSTLPRVGAYSFMRRHSPPPFGSTRVLILIDETEDTSMALYGEGVLIDYNNSIVKLDSLDADNHQKRSSISGIRSVFRNFCDPETGIVHTRAIPPWRTILYLMVVVDNDVLEAITTKYPPVPISFGGTLAPSAPPTAPERRRKTIEDSGDEAEIDVGGGRGGGVERRRITIEDSGDEE